MPDATFHFPRGFLWGTATAAHQVEGSNTNNNWYAWEQQPGRILQEHKSGLACDWWGGRWKEDFDRAAETYQNAHRLSVEWSRIQPAPDRWDEDALDHYRQMLQGMHARGLTPMVTLHHFTDPLWLAEQGGWENPQVVQFFERFVEKVVTALREYVNLWCTLNEPNGSIASGYIVGVFPPGKQDIRLALEVLTNQIKAHAAAYQTIHRLQPTARVGIALYYRGFLPAHSWSPLDKLVGSTLFNLLVGAFPETLRTGVLKFGPIRRRLPAAKGTQDYFGLNYYTRDLVAFNLAHAGELFGRRFFPQDADLSDTGFLNNDPEGFFEAIQWSTRFQIPILITENGVEDADDHLRPRYLAGHLHQLWRAINFNYPVKAYFHWTLVDNFEWERGWTQRFGLWELDVATQARRRRPSADLYAQICQENSLSSEMVRRWAPSAFSKIFPE